MINKLKQKRKKYFFNLYKYIYNNIKILNKLKIYLYIFNYLLY